MNKYGKEITISDEHERVVTGAEFRTCVRALRTYDDGEVFVCLEQDGQEDTEERDAMVVLPLTRLKELVAQAEAACASH